MNTKEYNRISSQIISAAIEVHKDLGPGLLESIYEQYLESELTKNGLSINFNVPVLKQGIRRRVNGLKEINYV